MAKPFTPNKVLRRAVTFKSSDRAIPDAEWIVSLTGAGVRAHRRGRRGESWFLSWRSVLGHALIHGMRRENVR